MRRREFIKLYETQKERVAREGKGDMKWFFGNIEGLGKQKLTGYQIGALIYLLIVPDSSVPAPEPEQEKTEKETVSGEKTTLSIPGIY